MVSFFLRFTRLFILWPCCIYLTVSDIDNTHQGATQQTIDDNNLQPATTAEDTLPAAEKGEAKENEWLTVWTVSEIQFTISFFSFSQLHSSHSFAIDRYQ